jgi:hypothetical protein
MDCSDSIFQRAPTSRAIASRTLNSSPMNSIRDREKDLTGRLLRSVSMHY